MANDIQITGVDKLERVVKALRACDDKQIRKDFYRGLNRATKTLKAAAKRNASETLPKAGGLAAHVAKSGMRTKTTGGGANVGVRIIASRKDGIDIASLDRGRLRHPVFGDRSNWVQQDVVAGWFTRPMNAGAEAVRRELTTVLDEIAERIEKA